MNIPAVLQYDPTGLRAATTASWSALDKKLEEIAPNHLVMDAWWPDREKIQEERQRKGLPAAMGKRYKYKHTEASYNQVRW
jgi:hypothetical protein